MFRISALPRRDFDEWLSLERGSQCPYARMGPVIFDRIADLKIREAIAEGRFEHLPNAGQPIDLDEYFQMPAEWRLACSILKSAKCLPEEVELLNEIASLERAADNVADADGARRRRLRDLRLRLAVLLDRNRRSR